MTDDQPTPDEKKEKSDRFRRILSQPEEGGLPPFEEFDLPEPADGETLIFDIEEPDPGAGGGRGYHASRRCAA